MGSYVNMEKTFDTQNLAHFRKARLNCPPVNESNFKIFMDSRRARILDEEFIEYNR